MLACEEDNDTAWRCCCLCALCVFKYLTDGIKIKQIFRPFLLYLSLDNVELILKDIGSRLGSESQEPEQPDYDSVASDEDAEREPGSGKDERTKVFFFLMNVCVFKLLRESGSNH